MNPVLKFNEIVTRLGDLDGSYEYLQINQGSSADSRGWFVARKVKHIPLSDIDHSVNYDEAHAKVVTLLEFDNGYKLNLKFWFTNYTDPDAGIVNGLTFKSVIRTSGGVENTPTGYNYAGVYPTPIGSGNYYHSTEAIVKQFGVKVVMCTMYEDVPYGGAIIEGVTEATRLYMRLFAPVIGSEFPGTIRSWAQVVDNAILNTNLYWQSDQPTYLYYPEISSQPNQSAGVGTIFSYTDLDELTRHLGLTEAPYDTGNPDEPTEPPQEEDPSQPGGGDGNYNPASDPVDFPTLPTGGVLSSGAVKAFLVSSATIIALFNKLWNASLFDISTFQKLLEAPLDSLIELECIPVMPTYGNNETIKLGNFDTEVTAPVITSQYITIDCGSKAVKRFWGSALDYEPYTKIEIFLPFVGIKTLHTDDVMNSTVHVKYNIDIFTGNLTAQVKCGQSVLYKYEGNCKATIPVSAKVNDMMMNMVRGLSHIAAGGIMGGLAGAGTAAISAAVNVAFSKTHVSRSGDISGVTGLLDDFVPYLIIHRPVQSLANNFKKEKGYPSNITATLSSLSGYTEVEYIHLTGISGATDTELQEIVDLLKRGVII